MDSLYGRACPVCAGGKAERLFSLPVWLKERILERIYAKFDVLKDIDPDLFRFTERALGDAVSSGFGEVRFGSPDYDFLGELERNNAVFAAFKTHRQQNDLAALLRDKDGNPRGFADFKKAAEPVIGKYNTSWLATEYNTAIRSARTAARFRKYMRDSDLFPNIRWLPSRSADPREAHMPYYNTVRAISDPWWKTHYPGCLWNCKCDMENTADGITHVGDNPAVPGAVPTGTGKPAAMPGLDRNPAYTGSIFTGNHPYVSKAYPGAEDAVREFLKEERGYSVVPVKKGRLRIHEEHGKNEKSENIRVASYFTDKYGYEIDLLPNSGSGKSADSYNWTLGVEQEYKVNTTSTKSSIDNLLRKAKDQADDIVLWVDSDLSWGDLADALKNRVNRSKNVTHVTLVKDGKDRRFSREEILTTDFKIQPADLK